MRSRVERVFGQPREGGTRSPCWSWRRSQGRRAGKKHRGSTVAEAKALAALADADEEESKSDPSIKQAAASALAARDAGAQARHGAR